MGQKLLLILTLCISGFLAVAESMDQMGNTFGMGQGGYSGMGSGDGFGGSAGSDVPDSFKDIVNRTQGSSMGSSPDSSMGSFSAAQKPQAKIGDGFYVVAMAGKMLGVDNVFAPQWNWNSRGTEKSYVKGSYGLNSIPCYLGLGYGMQFKGVYVGLEGFVGKIKNKNHYYYDLHFPGYNQPDWQEVDIGIKYAVASRLGYYISPVALLYGKLGVSENTIAMKNRGAGGLMGVSAKQEQSFNVRGYQWGGGLEVALNNYITARIETYQTIYKKFYISGGQPVTAPQPTGFLNRYKLRAQEMLLGISVKPSGFGDAMENSQYEEIPSGIYVGVEGGVSGTDFYRNVLGTQGGGFSNVLTKYTAHTASIKPAWGIYGGYAHAIGRFYVAGEAQLESNKGKVLEVKSYGNFLGDEYINNSLDISMALSTRLGYVFDKGTIGYGRIGFVRSKLRHRYLNQVYGSGGSETFGMILPYSKVLNGLRVGGGIEIALNQAMRLRGDYTLDIYPGVSFNGFNPGTRETIKATRNEVKLGLAYTLPPLY